MDFYYSQSDGLTIFNGIRDRVDIRRAIGVDYRVLPQSEFDENSVDVFGKSIARCWYDVNDKCIGIELYDLGSRFYIFNQELMNINYFEIKDILKKDKVDFFMDDEGLGINIFNDTVRFYIPKIDEYGEQAKVEAIWVKIPNKTIANITE